MRTVTLLMGVLAVIVMPVGPAGAPWLAATPAEAQTFIYSVKILCGLVSPPSVLIPLPGPKPEVLRTTEVNIHNFPPKVTNVQWKAVRARTSLTVPNSGQIGFLQVVGLAPNEAATIDCSEVYRALPDPPVFPNAVEGFVELVSNSELSVVAVYTSWNCQRDSKTDTLVQCGSDIKSDIEVVPIKESHVNARQ